MAASAPSASGTPPGVKPPKRSPVPRRTPGLSRSFIMASSRASARSSEVLRSTSMNCSSQYRATVCRAGARVNRSKSLRLDLRQFHVALPALRVALHERLHLLGRAGIRIERRGGEKLLRLRSLRDLVYPPGSLFHDGLELTRCDHYAPPR